MAHDLEGKHYPLAEPDAGGEIASQVGVDPAGCGSEHGLRGRTSAGGENSRDTRPDRATRFVETTQGVLSYTELAPLLASRFGMASVIEFMPPLLGNSFYQKSIIDNPGRRILLQLLST